MGMRLGEFRTQVGVALGGGLLGLWGCTPDQVPTAPPLSRSAEVALADDQPFYYYQDQKIFLREDPRRIVVSTTVLPSAAAVRAAVTALGLQADSATGLASVRGHWVLSLPGALPPAAALARARLKSDRRFEFVSAAYKTVTGGNDVIPVNRIVVQFKAGVTREQVDSINAALGTTVVRPPRPDSGFTTYWLGYPRDSAANPLRIAATLATHPLVAWADPDKISDRRPTYAPSDPYYPSQWHLRNTANTFGGIPVDINVEPAWDLTLGSNSINITVIDDGVDFRQIEAPGKQGYDLFYGNGYPDTDFDPFGNDTHGTSIAGIIGASHNNGVGVAGIAPNVVLNDVRIFRHTYPLYPGEQPPTQVASDAQICDGITWAYSSIHSDVISNSWGGGSPSNAITGAIQNATRYGRGGRGTVVVFAAGNTAARSGGSAGYVTYPGTLSTSTSVVTVGAIDRAGAPADYTPDGSAITLVAPSGHYTGACVGEIVTTDRAGSPGCNDGPNGDASFTSTFSGTSAATPQVAAVAALLLSREPELTAGGVKQRLIYGADSWGPSGTFGAGKLNAYYTLAPSAVTAVSISGPGSYIDTPGTYTWTASASGGTGSYTYQWQRSGDGSYFYNVGDGSPSYSEYEEGTYTFYLRVVVTSGTRNASDTAYGNVNTVGCGGAVIC